MAIILYNKIGQFQKCNEFSYLHLLDEGWFYSEKEALEAGIEKKEAEKETLEEAKEEKVIKEAKKEIKKVESKE